MSTGVSLLVLWVAGIVCWIVFFKLAPESVVAYTVYELFVLVGATYVLYLIHLMP